MCEEFQLNDLSVHRKNVVLVGGVSPSSCSGACVYVTCTIKVPRQFCVLCFRECRSLPCFYLADPCRYFVPNL